MKISSIKIEKSFTRFKDSQEIKFPNNKETNCAFIYGKNGSGKSSLSKLFTISNKDKENKAYAEDLLRLKTKNSDNELFVKIIYDNDNITEFKNNQIINPIKIPVFNQEYIDSKITYQEDFKNNKFKENTLNYGIELITKKAYITKVTEGKTYQKQKEDLINKIEEKIKESVEIIKKDTNTKDNNKNYALFNIEKLKSFNSKEIPDKDKINNLRLEHIAYIQNLKDLNENNKILFKCNFFELTNDFEKKLESINKSIIFNEDKEKTEASRSILDHLSEELRQWKLSGVNYIENNKCPFCDNDITSNELVEKYINYVDSKVSKMKQFISVEINEFNNYINNTDQQISIIKSKAQYLDAIFKTNLSEELEKFYNKVKEFLDKVLVILTEKIKNEYLLIDCSSFIEPIDINVYHKLKIQYDDLNKKITEINKKIDSSTSDKTKRNDEYFKTVAIYLSYYEVENEIHKLKDIEEKIKNILVELKPLKEAYESELREKNILLKKINEILDDFNINNYRVDEEFDLCLNGEKVSFCVEKLLSNGEKSIIAFALFISELELYYSDLEKNIIFIDDPISSLDYPNLYGIYNYINNLIEKNKNSQFIICSHNTMFLNLFKFDYPNKRAVYFKFLDDNGKTKILNDNDNLDSIYLEKLKEIFSVYKTNSVTNIQKLYIHNYCRYVLETISRFEYPINNNESTSSKYYLNKIIENIENKIDEYEISKISLQSLMKIVNKGSHATIDVVHDGEQFEDNNYIECCKVIIKFIKKEYNGQYELLNTDYAKMQEINK